MQAVLWGGLAASGNRKPGDRRDVPRTISQQTERQHAVSEPSWAHHRQFENSCPVTDKPGQCLPVRWAVRIRCQHADERAANAQASRASPAE
jgi:hypothetical protein